MLGLVEWQRMPSQQVWFKLTIGGYLTHRKEISVDFVVFLLFSGQIESPCGLVVARLVRKSRDWKIDLAHGIPCGNRHAETRRIWNCIVCKSRWYTYLPLFGQKQSAHQPDQVRLSHDLRGRWGNMKGTCYLMFNRPIFLPCDFQPRVIDNHRNYMPWSRVRDWHVHNMYQAASAIGGTC